MYKDRTRKDLKLNNNRHTHFSPFFFYNSRHWISKGKYFVDKDFKANS